MTTVPLPTVLLQGDVTTPELAPAVAWLRGQASCIDGEQGERVEPDAIVFCVARPGTVCRSTLEKLQRMYPLSQLLALAGPWCEGDVRSGKAWPGVSRIYWHQWQSRLPRELARLGRAAPRLPRTVTEVDLLVSRPRPPQASRPALVGVVSRRQTDFEAIAGALDVGGHHGVWISLDDAVPVLRLDAIIIDEDDAATAMSLCQSIQQRFGSLPSILLANFVRPVESSMLSVQLPTAVLAKPYDMLDLLQQLGAMVDSSGNRQPSRIAAA